MPPSTRPAARSYRLAVLDRLFVVEWVGTPRASEVDAVIDTLESRTVQRGAVRDFLVIVSKRASMPDHAGRLAYIRNVERTMSHCERLSIVLDGMPFINAFARGLVTTANIVPRYRGRTFVYDALATCLADLAHKGGRSPAELERSISVALA